MLEIGSFRFVGRMSPPTLQRSQIRDLLALLEKGKLVDGQKKVISFTGGFPSPETFPVEDLANCASRAIKQMPAKSLQYGPTLGLTPFREFLADYYSQKYEIELEAGNFLITASSQQALLLLAMAFCDQKRFALTESPTYLGAIQAFRFFGMSFLTSPLEKDGIDTNEIIWICQEQGEKIAYIYLVPFSQNPGGVTLSKAKARTIVQTAENHNIPIIEDNPYCELWFDEEPEFCSFLQLAPKNVLSIHTVSKTIAAGLRIGWIIGRKDVISKLGEVKQFVDLCTPSLNQLMVLEYMQSGEYDKHIPEIRKIYCRKRNLMLDLAEKYLPKELVSWNKPSGGLFLWAEFQEGINVHDLLEACIRKTPHGVAFVEGSQFCPDGRNTGARINFSYPTEEEMKIGMEVLGETIREIAS